MAEQVIRGVPAREGITLDPVYSYRPVTLDIPERVAGSFLDEMARFSAAIVQAHQELKVSRESVLACTGIEAEVAIFEVHEVMLDDPALEKGVRERLEAKQIVDLGEMIYTGGFHFLKVPS